MIEITSVNNDLIKEVVKLQQKKYRDQSGLFLLEGKKAITEAINSGLEVQKIFSLDEKTLKQIQGDVEVIKTNEKVLKKISTTDSAPEIVAVAKQKKSSLNELKSAKKILLLEDIKDLGNLGTILRTAVAFGIDGIVLYGETVDVYNPKCVRASVGNLWKIPVVQVKDFNILSDFFQEFEKIATLPKSYNSTYLNQFIQKEPYLVMFGSEANGLSQDLINFSTKKLTIEMQDCVESLNLSVSVGVVLYKLSF